MFPSTKKNHKICA